MNYSAIFKDIDNDNNLRQHFEKLINHNDFDVIIKEQHLSSIIQITLKIDLDTISHFKRDLIKIPNKEIRNEIINVINLRDGSFSERESLICKIYNKERLTEHDVDTFVGMSLEPNIYSLNLTTLLNLIKFCGLDLETQYLLSYKMADSGRIFDYRNTSNLHRKKILRRYPTGGVSEKVALIMPSLLKCLSKEYDFVSPFLVAKTLSFTGGTWDKLSSIPDFEFPDPGPASIDILSKHGVCMTVAKNDYNPSDTNLYQLRSLTNTVNSIPLIVTSIASKQIANPVDTLMLDIRYGKNAFLNTLEIANKFYEQIEPILDKVGINTIAEFTDTNTWYGASVGNYLEVIESVCLMRNKSSYGSFNFDNILLDQQKKLVISMAAKLINKQFNVPCAVVEQRCNELFTNESVFAAFKELLKSHMVSDETIQKIDDSLPFTKSTDIKKFQIQSHKSGLVEEINQKNIGTFVNIKLQSGSNFLRKENRFLEGVLLLKSEKSIVRKGETVALVFSSGNVGLEGLSEEFFKIN